MRRTAPLGCLLLTACLGVERIDVEPAEIAFISLDEKDTLKPIPRDSKEKLVASALRELEWSSSDPNVVKVDSVGQITTVGYGAAEVRVSAGGKTGVCKVRVAKPAKVVIEPEAIELVAAGEPKQLSAKAFDDQGVEIPTRLFSWSSKDKSVVKVESGEARGLNPGQGKVAAKCGDAVGEASVTVKYPEVASMKIEPAALEMAVGETQPLPTYTFDAAGKPLLLTELTFKSAKPKIVSVDENGVLHAHKKGRATVRAIVGAQHAEASVVVH